jgi:hypothetical protein
MMRGALGIGALQAALVLGLAMRATAQDAPSDAPPTERACTEGRVRVEGYCCWPAQRWDAALGRCEGAPTCPGELVEHGAACVAPAAAIALPEPMTATVPEGYETGGYAAAPRTTRTSAAFADSTAAWPSIESTETQGLRRAFVARGEDEGLILAALVVADVGWVLGWLGTMLGEIGGSCGSASCNAWPWAFVPIGGAMAAGLVSHNGFRDTLAVGLGFGIPSVILQGIGAIMAIIAFSNETTEIVLQPISVAPGLSASLERGAPGADGGLSLGLTF